MPSEDKVASGAPYEARGEDLARLIGEEWVTPLLHRIGRELKIQPKFVSNANRSTDQMNYDFPIDRVVTFLNELADEDFQRRVWLASSDPEVSSFDEAICGLFDDTGLGRLLEKQVLPVFDTGIDESLKELERLAMDASHEFQSMPPTSVIEHPKMREIRSAAVKALAKMVQEGIV